jgi:hypothetical protein
MPLITGTRLGPYEITSLVDRALQDVGRGRPSGRPVPIDEALTIAVQITDALAAAHRASRTEISNPAT